MTPEEERGPEWGSLEDMDVARAKLEAQISSYLIEWWGERCEDFEPGCECCVRWRAFDILIHGNQAPPQPDPRPRYNMPFVSDEAVANSDVGQKAEWGEKIFETGVKPYEIWMGSDVVLIDYGTGVGRLELEEKYSGNALREPFFAINLLGWEPTGLFDIHEVVRIAENSADAKHFRRKLRERELSQYD